MSAHDQAAGLRKWADLQRQQRGDEAPPEATESPRPMAYRSPVVPSAAAMMPPVGPPVPKTPLMVIGLPNAGPVQVRKVSARLGQWAALGRAWAKDPADWDIRIVMPDAPELARLSQDHRRWALWIHSDADAFGRMYHVLKQLSQHNGPQRLLALHEPNLPRQGLLENLQQAAKNYLGIELLLLAR
ncbi:MULTISPECIES: hypothetical protein [unclassified Halomonas]|uniref:hypothetical protein n=1 Tax=unclassified Halomonas TaxID=2609666 RepID=UPI0006DA8456|nr:MULTISPECIES: hypothetical protein [unclassified Halomonas]KPQ18788.1 MAG: hypothetical protein HLUCCO06_02950 [Halomonas sp. HL-93]SBR52302.1 hypothetical protein GA0071314_3646 [Halomonas sp. HL-93]SNY98076.1 hypothetical protein SAMN04488142_2689 [Halomonas sp. hl-4]